MPASNIDPKVGASTCATGSHACNPSMGNLTPKTTTHNLVKIQPENFSETPKICKSQEPFRAYKFNKLNKNGKLRARV
jgi:hypothetical protein